MILELDVKLVTHYIGVYRFFPSLNDIPKNEAAGGCYVSEINLNANFLFHLSEW